MGISYGFKTTPTGTIELYSRQFDGNETDITSLARLTVSEAENLLAGLSVAISTAREIERDQLEKRREQLTAEFARLKGALDRVVSEIAALDVKQGKTRTVEASSLMVDGTRMVQS